MSKCMRNKSAVFYLYLIIIWKVSYFVGIAPTCLTIFSHDSIQFSPWSNSSFLSLRSSFPNSYFIPPAWISSLDTFGSWYAVFSTPSCLPDHSRSRAWLHIWVKFSMLGTSTVRTFSKESHAKADGLEEREETDGKRPYLYATTADELPCIAHQKHW